MILSLRRFLSNQKRRTLILISISILRILTLIPLLWLLLVITLLHPGEYLPLR